MRKNPDALPYFLRTIPFQHVSPLDRGGYCKGAHNGSFITEVTSVHKSRSENRGSTQRAGPVQDHAAFTRRAVTSRATWPAFRLSEPAPPRPPIGTAAQKRPVIQLSRQPLPRRGQPRSLAVGSFQVWPDQRTYFCGYERQRYVLYKCLSRFIR